MNNIFKILKLSGACTDSLYNKSFHPLAAEYLKELQKSPACFENTAMGFKQNNSDLSVH